ncbi:MAG: hypothetical protein QXH30_01575 [Candidatus Bilamarchaeaceae archaeon]
MAPVAKRRNTWFLFLALALLFAAVAGAGFISPCDICYATDLQLDLNGYTLSATLLLFNATMDIEHEDLSTLQQSYESAQVGQTTASYDLLEEEELDLGSLFEKTHTEAIRPENAEIYFYYYKTTYDSTEEKSISERVDVECLEGENPRLTDESGIANCTLPEEAYKGTCTMVYASFCKPELPSSDICQQVKPSTAQAYVCDSKKSDSIANLSAILKDNLSVLSAPICFVSMLLGGLLLASMFFSGRSPLSLLDITTPLLPKAKSISYSGISTGTGLARMGRAADLMTKEIEKSSAETLRELKKFYMQSIGFNPRLLGMVLDSDASNTMKMLALRALIAGRGQREIERILGVRFGEKFKEESEELGRLISSLKASPIAELNKRNRLDDAVVNLAEQRVFIEMQKKAFSAATGEGGRLRKAINKTLGELPVVGDHFRAFTASALFATKQLKQTYSSFTKGVARAAIGPEEMKLIQMSVEAERAKGRKPGGFAGWVALSEEERGLVTLFNVYERGSTQYTRKMQEAKNDVLNWLLRKLLEHYGAQLNLNEEQVLEIGHKGPSELMFRSFNARAFSKIEQELRAILSSNRSEYEKAELLMQIMARDGVSFDRAGVLAAMKMLQRIEQETPFSYRDAPASDRYANQEAVLNFHRLIRLQKYLEEQFKVSQGGIDPQTYFANRFYFSIGRPDLKYVWYDETGRMRILDQTFSTYYISEYRKQLESWRPGQKHPISFLDVANYSFLRIVNERWGLMDPATPGLSAEVKLVMERARQWLLSLASPDAFRGTPSMGDLLNNLYVSDKRELAPGKKYEKDMLAVAGHGFEYGPVRGAWRMDMKAHWRTLGGAMGGARTSVENQSYKEVYYSHAIPSGVHTIMESYRSSGTPISQQRAMERYFKQSTARNLFERLKGIIELESPNTYFTSQREFEFVHSIRDAYREYLARKQGKKEFEISDREVEKLISKPIGIKELGEDSWIRLREGQWVPFSQKHSFKLAQADRVVNAMAYIKQDGVWKEFVPEKLLSDGVFRKRMRTLEEFGDITPANNEVLRRYHALIAGLKAGTAQKAEADSFISLVVDFNKNEGKDSRKGIAYSSLLLRLACEDASIKKELARLNVSLEDDPRLAGKGFGDSIKGGILAHQYLSARSQEEHDKAVAALKAWAREGSPQDNRQLRVAMLFYNYGVRSGNMADFNSYDEGIRIAPMGMKSFTTEIGGVERIEQVGGFRNWLRQVFRPLNLELEQFTMSAFGKQTRSEYEGSLVSEYYRETGAKFAGKLLAGEFGNVSDRDSRLMRAYNSLADAFGRYHAIWDETITRDPRGNSSAIGHSFIFSSFFHHGPAMPFGPAFYRRWTTPGILTPWYSKDRLLEGFHYLKYTPQMFNWMLAAPFIGAYRTFLTSKFGYPSKYDRNYITAENKQATAQYEAAYAKYKKEVDSRVSFVLHEKLAANEEEARRIAVRELASAGISPPQPPPITFERSTMDPFMMTSPRDKDAWRSLTNWFYASFDPTSTSIKRNLMRLISPASALIPSATLHAKILGAEWSFAGSFHNPYYVSPEGVRGEMIKRGGPMIKRQYGGTEILTGVVRAPEDMWAYQAGVNAVWGNANPGASYVDFSNTLQMDARAANYLRYESRFRPYLSHDQYIEKQANLGIAKREIDPTMMMLERNRELRGYRAPDNRLYQFLNPATFILYRAASAIHRGKRFVNDVQDFAEGISTYDGSNRGIWVYGQYAAARGANFFERLSTRARIKFATELRYCSCGSAMPADGVCPACSQKMRCGYCNSLVVAHQTHICQHGLRRNLLMDELQANGYLGGMDIWRNSARRWGRGA